MYRVVRWGWRRRSGISAARILFTRNFGIRWFRLSTSVGRESSGTMQYLAKAVQYYKVRPVARWWECGSLLIAGLLCETRTSTRLR